MALVPSLESLTTAVILLDEQQHIAYLNQSAAQLLGYSSRHLKQESFFELIEGEFNLNLLLRFSAQQQRALIEEITLKTATGQLTANIVLSHYPIDDQDFIMLELQTSEHQANIRKDLALQRQSRISNHLIRNLAHEIKNPLGGIKGAAQLLERKLVDEINSPYCQIIIREADRLNELVDRLLLPAKPEQASQINPHQLIEQALQIVLLQDKSQVSIVKDYDPSLPDLTVSPGQIQQALLNLLKNAVEAMQDTGEIKLRTRIQLQHNIGKLQHRKVIRIDVIDNGPGIPKHLLKDIFYPTISGKNSSGLGLSIAQSLAQRNQGIIEVENSPGKTCFSLFLPLVTSHE